MKHTRELKVGLLAIVSACILYFGFYFLKGVNIFSPVKSYHGIYASVDGLTEQAPVYIRGYKVGQVDRITYDFSKENAFVVQVSVDKSVQLPEGTQMVLVSDGLLGGKAISLCVPCGTDLPMYASGSELPTSTELGLVENLEQGVLSRLDQVLKNVDSLVVTVNGQLADSNLYEALEHINHLTADLEVSAQDIRAITRQQLPSIMTSADSAMKNLGDVAQDIKQANLPATVQKVDGAVDAVSAVLSDENSTLGKLLHDETLYRSITGAVQSADSLIVDLKARPKRYVHFSLFGKKEK